MNHLDREVNEAIRDLCAKLIQWERTTGRQSILILRENNGEQAGERMTKPGFALRAVNGIPLGRDSEDMQDDWLLRPFVVDTTTAG